MGGSNQNCRVERSVFQLKEVSERIPMFARVGIVCCGGCEGGIVE